MPAVLFLAPSWTAVAAAIKAEAASLQRIHISCRWYMSLSASLSRVQSHYLFYCRFHSMHKHLE